MGSIQGPFRRLCTIRVKRLAEQRRARHPNDRRTDRPINLPTRRRKVDGGRRRSGGVLRSMRSESIQGLKALSFRDQRQAGMRINGFDRRTAGLTSNMISDFFSTNADGALIHSAAPFPPVIRARYSRSAKILSVPLFSLHTIPDRPKGGLVDKRTD